jgi:hypothetical protein
MKHFVIKYQFSSGNSDAWHEKIAGFIEALDTDPDLKGKISYRVMKDKNGHGYYHFVSAADDAPGILQKKEFFKPYQEQTRLAAGGAPEVVTLELVAQTAYRA